MSILEKLEDIRYGFLEARADALDKKVARDRARCAMRTMRACRNRVKAGVETPDEIEYSIELATETISYYDDEIFSEESHKHFGAGNIIGKALWVLILAIAELALWIGAMWLLVDLGLNVQGWPFYIVCGIVLLAIAIPLDGLFTVHMFSKWALKARIRKMRLWRDELRDMVA